MTTNMWIASVAWLAIITGYLNRRKQNVHVPLVLSGIFLDIALVVYLQLTRDAMKTALAFKLAILPQLHIAASTTALVLYFPVIYYGIQLLSGNASAKTRGRHRFIARSALFFRTLGFFLMFSMVE